MKMKDKTEELKAIDINGLHQKSENELVSIGLEIRNNIRSSDFEIAEYIRLAKKHTDMLEEEMHKRGMTHESSMLRAFVNAYTSHHNCA